MSNQANMYNEEKLAYYESLYRPSVLAKPQEINLTITSAHIYGQGFVCEQKGTQETDPEYCRFNCSLDQITKIYVNENKKASPLYIQLEDTSKGYMNRKRIILPCLDAIDNVIKKIYDVKAEYDELVEKRAKKEEELRRKRIEEKIAAEAAERNSSAAPVEAAADAEPVQAAPAPATTASAEPAAPAPAAEPVQEAPAVADTYADEIYARFIGSTERPVAELQKSDNGGAYIYAGEDNSLNFLVIDGEGKKYAHGVIAYDDINYYEKCQTLGYEAHALSSSFGGTFLIRSRSIISDVIKGAMFGPMGITPAGDGDNTIEKYPSEIQVDAYRYTVAEDNVVLRFMSQTLKRYIELELSPESYSFFQTYFPEKKYGLIMEGERQNAAEQAFAEIMESAQAEAAPKVSEMAGAQEVLPDMTLEEFEVAVKKLKSMRDNDLISAKEFKTEKEKLLSMLY
ncbi:MAG: hypothetical protein MSH60_11615 [Ruminococcus sp.]|nr:hypothetical protein [Ruminococcus sp.]